MLPLPFYPRSHRVQPLPYEGGPRAPREGGPRMSDHKMVENNGNEEYSASLYPNQMYSQPPPTVNLQPSRSPGYPIPPPNHIPSWLSVGQISPAVETSTSAGRFYTGSPNSPSPNLSFFSSKASSRQRTLIEIPRHDQGLNHARTLFEIPTYEQGFDNARNLAKGRDAHEHIDGTCLVTKATFRRAGAEMYCELSSREKLGIEVPTMRTIPRPINIRKFSVSESTLDPNSRPFTPSGRYHPYNICISETVSVASDSIPDQMLYQRDGCSAQGYYEEEFYDDLLGSEQFDLEQEYDPLPEDPSTFLPDLDLSMEDCNNNNNNGINFNYNTESRLRLEPLLPPLIPDTAWKSGSLRPPLLPTPLNFPPFGPSKLEALSTKKRIFSEPERTNKFVSDSRLLVSGVEESLNALLSSSLFTNSAEKIRRLPDHVRAVYWKQQPVKLDPPWGIQPLTNFSTGGIMCQDLSVPAEYQMAHIIEDRIRPINIRQEHTDLLFFLFYTLHGDALQLVAASLLFERGWRYHKQDRIWLARWPGVKPEEKTVLFEKGLYQYFDVVSWKRIPGWFRLDYCHLADKTLVPEDLKTLYSRYPVLLRDVQGLCSRSIAISGFSSEASEDFESIEGIKYLSCII